MAAADDTELVAGEDETEEPPFSGLLRLAVAHESRSCRRRDGRCPGGPAARRFARRGVSHARGGRGRGNDTQTWSLGNQPRRLVETDVCDTRRRRGSARWILDRDEVPEVIWFELRYYDGASWQSSWDSQHAGSAAGGGGDAFRIAGGRACGRAARSGRGNGTRRSRSPALRTGCVRRRTVATTSSADETSSRPDQGKRRRLLTIVVSCSWRRRARQ